MKILFHACHLISISLKIGCYIKQRELFHAVILFQYPFLLRIQTDNVGDDTGREYPGWKMWLSPEAKSLCGRGVEEHAYMLCVWWGCFSIGKSTRVCSYIASRNQVRILIITIYNAHLML